MKDAFRYTLRFAGDPAFAPGQDLDDVLKFAQQARIDDVAMFIDQQDLNTGHLSLEELEEYAEYFTRFQQALAPLGVTLSVNQWYSLMHADLGWPLRPGQDFARMVDVDGMEAACCVCPADENWQQYFCQSFARMAQLEPDILWVEDDFRYHNHEPLFWGGCFCDKHMALYSEKAGKPLSRREFVQGILQPGAPHPYRRIWLATCRETQQAVAEKLGAAVRAVSTTAKVGLMSSAPYMHAAEGRHWAPLLKAFAAGRPMVDRIHLPGYVEASPAEYAKNFNMVAMQTRHFIPPEAEIYPELENYPYSLFTKSLPFTRFQLLCSLPLNERGVAMNLFDLNGNGIVFEEGFQHMLAGAKDYLNRMTAQGVFALQPRGVKVLCSEDSAATLHTAAGGGMEELCPEEVFFAGLLPAMGIPFAFCSNPAVEDSIVAVSGQYFRNLSEEQLAHLFRHNFVILSGDALDTLCQMGQGRLAGVQSARWMAQNGGEFSFEQEAVPSGQGARPGRASAIIFCSDALAVEYAAPHEALSHFYNAKRQQAAPAHTLVEGRVLVYPFGRFGGPLGLPPMLLNPVRQRLLQGALATVMQAGKGGFPLVLGAPHLLPYYYQNGGRHCLYLVNATSGPVHGLRLRLPAAPQGQTVHCARSFGEAIELPARFAEGVLSLGLSLPPMEAVLLRWE